MANEETGTEKKPFYKSVADTVTGFLGGGVTGAVVGGVVLAAAGAATAAALAVFAPSTLSFAGDVIGKIGDSLGVSSVAQSNADLQAFGQAAKPALELMGTGSKMLASAVLGAGVGGVIGAAASAPLGAASGAVTGWVNSRPDSDEVAHQQELARAQATGIAQGATLAQVAMLEQRQNEHEQATKWTERCPPKAHLHLHAPQPRPALFTAQLDRENTAAATTIQLQ